MPWRNADLVSPNLFVANSQAITQSGFLSNNSVTHILSVCEDQVSIIRRTPPIVQYRIGVPDADETNLLVWLPIACQFIHEALTNGGVVVVHSSEGECRAPAVVAAYLMATRRLSAADAQYFVRHAHEQTKIRETFNRQLIFFGLCDYQPHEGHPIYRKWLQEQEGN